MNGHPLQLLSFFRRLLAAWTVLAASTAFAQASLPLRTWEAVPHVVRPDGADSFRLEVRLPARPAHVRLALTGAARYVHGSEVELVDDGTGADLRARDSIYTAGPLRIDPAYPMPASYAADSSSPGGLAWLPAGDLTIVEAGGETSRFLDNVTIGVVRGLPAANLEPLSPAVAVAPHLVNIRISSASAAQQALRGDTSGLTALTRTLYATLADDFDFLFLLSSGKSELEEPSSSANFLAGAHIGVRVPFTGTGIGTYDVSSSYGSAGKLQAINILDYGLRGLNSGNATHELLHHWAAYAGNALGFNQDSAHYSPRSNIGSLLGGTKWTARPDGGWDVSCTEGITGATRAAPLDLYLMGIIGPESVPAVRVYDPAGPWPLERCGGKLPIRPSEIVRTVTPDQIERLHGARLPGPSAAQHGFRIAFVIATQDRWLTPVETAFYEELAAAYAAPLPSGAAAPLVGQNWAPVTAFFGHGVTFNTAIARQAESVPFQSGVDFAASLTQRLQGAAAPPEALSGMAARLECGLVSRAALAAELLTDPQFAAPAALIVQTYLAAFGRDPDYAAWASWMDRLRDGLAPAAFFGELLRQPEFRMMSAMLDDRAYARQVYRNIYGSDPPGAILTQWANALASGYSRADLLLWQMSSPAFAARTGARASATALYLGLALRPPSPSEAETAAALIAAGGDVATLAAPLLP